LGDLRERGMTKRPPFAGFASATTIAVAAFHVVADETESQSREA
jgi:hypothetical protein